MQLMTIWQILIHTRTATEYFSHVTHACKGNITFTTQLDIMSHKKLRTVLVILYNAANNPTFLLFLPCCWSH